MRLKETHGRRGEATEYYSWKVKRPEVFAQRVGTRWMLGVQHLDKTCQVLAYFDDVAAARHWGTRLTQLYATAEHYTVKDDEKLARDFWLQLDAKRSASLIPIVLG